MAAAELAIEPPHASKRSSPLRLFFLGMALFSASILMVALTYHALLAGLWNPQGLAWWANQGLHSAVPLAYLLWWVAFAAKDVTRRDLPKWLIYPAAYCVYALVRGSLTGFWPYPFLNNDTLGPVRLTVNIGAMLAGFALIGLAVLALAKRLNRSG